MRAWVSSLQCELFAKTHRHDGVNSPAPLLLENGITFAILTLFRGQDWLLCPQAPHRSGQEQVLFSQVPFRRSYHQQGCYLPGLLNYQSFSSWLRDLMLFRSCTPRLSVMLSCALLMLMSSPATVLTSVWLTGLLATPLGSFAVVVFSRLSRWTRSTKATLRYEGFVLLFPFSMKTKLTDLFLSKVMINSFVWDQFFISIFTPPLFSSLPERRWGLHRWGWRWPPPFPC